MKLTVQELATIIEIMNVRSNRSHTIKDLKLIQNIVDTLKDYLPVPPLEPTEKTPEAMAVYKNECQEYHTYEVDVDLHSHTLDLIKIKFANTNVFFDDENSRKRVLTLASKLGI